MRVFTEFENGSSMKWHLDVEQITKITDFESFLFKKHTQQLKKKLEKLVQS